MIYIYAHFYNFLFTQTLQRGAAPLSYNKGSCDGKLQRSSDLSSPVVGLHSVGRFISGRFCWVCLGTGEFLRPQGPSPQAFNPSGGRFIAWRLRRPKKGNADWVEGIFGLARRVWASALRLDPPLKRPCAIFVRWWDV